MYDVKTVTDVSSETALVSLSDVKAHLYITHSDDDTYLTALIGKCRKMVEHYCNIAIVKNPADPSKSMVKFSPVLIDTLDP